MRHEPPTRLRTCDTGSARPANYLLTCSELVRVEVVRVEALELERAMGPVALIPWALEPRGDFAPQ